MLRARIAAIDLVQRQEGDLHAMSDEELAIVAGDAAQWVPLTTPAELGTTLNGTLCLRDYARLARKYCNDTASP